MKLQLERAGLLTPSPALINSLIREDTGSELVEYSLCLTVWTILVFGVLYASMLVYADHYVASAANAAARYTIVRGSSYSGTLCTVQPSSCSATTTDVRNFVKGTIPPGLSADNLSVETTWPGTTPTGTSCDTLNGNNSPNCAVQVNVRYRFSFPMPIIPQNEITLNATSSMSILE